MPLIPMHETDDLRKAGVHYPATPESWRWLFRTRRERGVEEAFVRVGRRILVDTEVLLDRMRQGEVPSGGRRVAPAPPPVPRVAAPAAPPPSRAARRRAGGAQ
jgi:hypothetical protein